MSSTGAGSVACVTPALNSSDPVSRAQCALIALLDSGVPLSDPRVETLLALIHRYKLANPQYSTSDRTFPPQRAYPTQTPPLRHPHFSNHHHDTSSTLLPIAARRHGSDERSFLLNNQTALATGRLALELSSGATNRSADCVDGPDQTVSPAKLLSRRCGAGNSHATPPLLTQDLLNAFQIARSVSGEKRRGLSNAKRKDVKSPPRRRTSGNAGGNATSNDVPFVEQHVCGVPADIAFQIKAQAEAIRHFVRGADLPTEVCVAARGTPPSRVTPHVGSVLVRGSTDVEDGCASATDPSLHTPMTLEFDPRRLSRFAPNHVFGEADVLMPGESTVPSAELQTRLALAKAHHNRLYAHALSRSDDYSKLPSHEAGFDEIDGKALQNCATLVDQLCVAQKQHFSAPPLRRSIESRRVISKEFKTKAHVSKPPETNSRRMNYASEFDRAVIPITVFPSPGRAPSLPSLLQAREKRVATKVNSRLQEIDDMLSTAECHDRDSLLRERKQICLLPLQKRVRASVLETMHRALHQSGVSDISASRIAILKRKSLANGLQNGVAGEMLGRTPKTEESYRSQQQAQRQVRREKVLRALLNHSVQFKGFSSHRVTLKKRLLKDLERYFQNRSKEEEKRRKKEQMDRIRALRDNDEDEYLKLLKTTKNKRLIHLLRQTDEYLVQIGAQVERQKQAAREEEAADGSLAADEASPNGATTVVDDSKSQSDEDELNQLRKRRNDYYTISHTISEKVYQPKGLVGGKLKPYQLEGLEWLVSLYNNNLNGILADEMGLGKTIQTLSLIMYLVEVKNVSGPFLIIVPLSVISNWVRELERWAPSLVKVVYKGDLPTRRYIYSTQVSSESYNVLLTTYEFVVRDKIQLGRVRWKYIIMDEGHRMKNAECKLALTLGAKYTSRNRLLLTGTPLQNNMTELWALLNFLLPSIFSSAETFETWFNAPFQESLLGDSAELNEEENLLIISRLHQVLRPFMLRRLKTDVEAHLPDKVEIVFRCNMSSWQRVLYRQVRNRLGIASGAGNGSVKSFNNAVMQFKKVCNHPFLFYREDDLMSIPSDFLMRASGKFELLDHVLRKLKRTGHRVLIFSQMTAALDYLELFLSTIHMKHLRLDGMTKADDRQKMLERFNAPDSEFFCFLLSTRAGGLGLNLQTADTVIIFDSDWNPMMDLQAQDRAHRIGQTKEVRVYRLICSRSIEVNILERATRKLQIESQVIQAGQFNNKSSDNDRHEMLKDLLRQQNEDDATESEDATSLEEINRKLARSDDEYEIFQQVDEDLRSEASGRSRLLVAESDLPKWVFQPEQEEKQKEQSEADYFLEHGRGRRKRKQVIYDDNLTEREWTLAMEEDGDIVEAAQRKRRRVSSRRVDSAITESDQDDDQSTGGRMKRTWLQKATNGEIELRIDDEDADTSTLDVHEAEEIDGRTNSKGNPNASNEVSFNNELTHIKKRRKRERPYNPGKGTLY